MIFFAVWVMRGGSDRVNEMCRALKSGLIFSIYDGHSSAVFESKTLTPHLLNIISTLNSAAEASPAAGRSASRHPSSDPFTLGIEGWDVISVKTEPGEYVVEADLITQPTGCRHCGAPFIALVRRGTRKRRAIDVPQNGRRVTIFLTKQLYLCRRCDGVSEQPVPGIPRYGSFTERLHEFIRQQSEFWPPTVLARYLGVERLTISRHLNAGYTVPWKSRPAINALPEHSRAAALANDRRNKRANALAYAAANKRLCTLIAEKLREMVELGERIPQLSMYRPAVPDVERIIRALANPRVDERELLDAIEAEMSPHLPEQIKDDVRQELALAVLSGEIRLTQLERKSHRYVRHIRRLHPDKWGPLSLDQPLPGDGLPLRERIPG
jgi:hypothetical protein